uniref:Retrotransposon gag domain-containing protein n=1 Tax=Brassica oleracea var. oleracea TaxID=109376 RepID=A0A0D3A8S2_BRAOL
MTVDEHNEPSDDAQRVAELQKQVDEKLSQLQSENTVLRDQNQARSRACNKKRRFNTQVRPMGNLNTPNSGEGATDPAPGSGVAGATHEGAENAQVHNLEESDSEPESDKETPKNISATESSMTAYLEKMFSKRFDAMQSMVGRLPGVAPPIRRSNPDSYADSPFVKGITSVKMPRKFSFPNIKMYDGTGDPDDHIAQYKQRMLAVVLPKESREATMCKGFGSTLIGPALQWYINLPTRSISSFASLNDKFVERFASSRSLEKTSNGLYEILQHQKEGMSVSTKPDISHLSISTPELVNVLRQMGQQVKWPQNMNAPDSFRKPGLWCNFHRDHGHKTEDCVALRIEVNELLQKGNLREFLSEKAKNHLNKEVPVNSPGAIPASPPRQDRVIHVISGGSEISGVNHAAAKKSTRNAKHGLETTKPKLLLLGTDEISFTAKEQEKIRAPHHNALVISLNIANCLVKRILVDNGSSSSIIFQTAPGPRAGGERPDAQNNSTHRNQRRSQSISIQHDPRKTLDSRHGSSPFNPSSNGEIPYTLGHQNNQRRSGEFLILLLDHLKGKDQGLIAITEETSGPANQGTRGQEVWRIAMGSEDADPEPPKDWYRPLRMVSLKVLQSGTCSEDRDLARSSSSTPHGSRQLPTDGLATKEAGHKQIEETSSEIIPDGSGAEGNIGRESPITRESTEAGAPDKSRSRSPNPREKQYPAMERGTTRQGNTPTILNKPA